jgi:formyltetrahydrofolate-dependent phosphoribosylglycinamide formyltransferase
VLSAPFVARWRGRILNIHPSLLPAFRGLDTHRRALEAGVKIHGCTVHFVEPELDAGPIIAQSAVPVCEEDTAETLAERVLEKEHQLYAQALALVAAGRVKIEDGRTRLEIDLSARLTAAIRSHACAIKSNIGEAAVDARRRPR